MYNKKLPFKWTYCLIAGAFFGLLSFDINLIRHSENLIFHVVASAVSGALLYGIATWPDDDDTHNRP